MLKRFLIAAPTAAVVAAGLFWAMSLVISNDRQMPTYVIVAKGSRISRIYCHCRPWWMDYDEVFVDRPKDDSALRGKLPPPPKVDPYIAKPQPIPGKRLTPPRLNNPSSDGIFDRDLARARAGLINLCKDNKDTPYPLVRMAPPAYPVPGVEADIVLEFTVGIDGMPRDVRVVRSSDPRFDEYAIKTVKRWRYRPQCEDGVAIERKGMRVRLEYVPLAEPER